MPITKLMEGLPNPSMPQAEFDQASARFMGELPAWGAEANALAADVNAKQVAAGESATLATQRAAAATSSAEAAHASEISAGLAEDAATLAAQAAAASAVEAAAIAAAFVSVCAQQHTVGAGQRTFVIEEGKQFKPGTCVLIVNAANSAQYFFGPTLTYSGPNLLVDVQAVSGAGAIGNNWTVTISGPRGVPGPVGSLSGANMTNALNAARAADLASAPTIDPWSGAGNFMVLTGDATVSSAGTAPQAGVDRTLLVSGRPVFVCGADFVIKGVRQGRAIALGPGDEIELHSETTTRIRVTIFKADGSSPSDRSRLHAAMLSF